MRFVLSLVLGVLLLPCHAQSLTEARDAFLKEAGDNASLYRGRLEQPYNRLLYVNLPFLYEDEEFHTGTVCFNGIIYPNVPIRLNLFTNIVTVVSPIEKKQIIPDQNKIEYFVIDQDKFVSHDGIFMKESFAGKNLQLYTYLRYIRDVEVISGNTYKEQFALKTSCLLCKDGIDYEVAKLKDVKKLFPERSKEIQQFAKANRLKFNKDLREMSLASIVQFLEKQGL